MAKHAHDPAGGNKDQMDLLEVLSERSGDKFSMAELTLCLTESKASTGGAACATPSLSSRTSAVEKTNQPRKERHDTLLDTSVESRVPQALLSPPAPFSTLSLL
jgi:hypothetical protein